MIQFPDGDAVEAGITEQGRWAQRPAAGSEPLPGRFILPGLVDAHCHLSVATRRTVRDVPYRLRGPAPLPVLRAIAAE